jgi:hypothetical protein
MAAMGRPERLKPGQTAKRLFLGPGGVGRRTSDLVLDTAVTRRVTSDNPEVTLLTPERVPRVGDLPVPARDSNRRHT